MAPEPLTPRRGRPLSERALALRDARRVQRTAATNAAAALALVAAALGPLLTVWSVGEVNREFDVLAVRSPLTGSLSPFLLTYLAAGATALGAIGLLTRQPWGWWGTVGGASFGLADLARLYVGLFGSINLDHPRAAEVTLKLAGIVALPAAIFIAVGVLLSLRSVRVACRVAGRGAPSRAEADTEEGG